MRKPFSGSGGRGKPNRGPGGTGPGAGARSPRGEGGHRARNDGTRNSAANDRSRDDGRPRGEGGGLRAKHGAGQTRGGRKAEDEARDQGEFRAGDKPRRWEKSRRTDDARAGDTGHAHRGDQRSRDVSEPRGRWSPVGAEGAARERRRDNKPLKHRPESDQHRDVKRTAVPRPDRRSAPPPRRIPEGSGAPTEPMRIAKAMARAGLCSRREAERWIEDGRVSVNGKTLHTPACEVGPKDRVLVDGRPLPTAEPARLWRYHKPRGLVTTHADPEGRPTVFDALPPELPRVVSVGRLDFNTEGLLLLTNDGALARHLELPATGWLRRYRVRAHGRVTQGELDKLKDGIEIEGVRYGPIEATLDSTQGANMWLTVAIREGKNREVRKILSTFALDVNRLIRISYGPFQLLDLQPGAVELVRNRTLADQLGPKLARELGLTQTAEDHKARWKGKQADTTAPKSGDGDGA